MVAWKQWKYPLTLSLFFLLIYGFVGILDPTPSVNLPDDIRLLLNDRQRLQPSDDTSTQISVVMEHNIQAIVASELWYHAEERNDDIGKRQLESNKLEIDQMHNKLSDVRTQHKGRISDKTSNSFDDDKKEQEAFDRWSDRREIVGNERFVNRFQNGIQKPEDFYERNKDAVVKIKSNDRPTATTKMPSTEAFDVNTNKSNSLTFLATEKPQKSRIYADIQNTKGSQKTKPSNATTDFEHFVQKDRGTTTSFNKDDSLHEVSRKTETAVASVQKGSRSTHIRYTNSSRSGSGKRIRRKSKVNGTTLADLESAPYPPKIVKATGAFLERVHAYNAAIAAVSAEILKRRGYGPWRDVADPTHLKVVWANTDDFLERVSEHARVTTVLLPWIDDSRADWSSLDDRSNVLVNSYYAWSASPPLCAWIRTPGFTKARWDAVYDRECNEDMSLAARPQSLEFMYFYAKPININHYWPNFGTVYPAYFYTRPPPHVFYVHLLQDVVVNTVGDVISGDLKLVPYTCSHDNLPTICLLYTSDAADE